MQARRDNRNLSIFDVAGSKQDDVFDLDEDPYEVISIENIGNFLPDKVQEEKEVVLLDMGGDEGELKMTWN